jgi:prepilin-type N-terminal cleavage/methylation domain-containing protein
MILASSGIRQGHVRQGYLKGFTLIELLVVIAIIGILSSVVLASLNTARAKGADAAIKANVDSARAQAELFYDTGSTYSGVCAAASSASPGGILTMKQGASTAGSANVVCIDPATNSNMTGWAMSAQLKTNTAQYFCADSTGTTTIRASQLTTGASGSTGC